MKKFMIFFILTFLSVSLSAQEHLTFKNIPIEGSVSAYVAKLEAVGFYLLHENDGRSAILQGSFAGFDDCTVYVIGSKSSKTVWKVVVGLPHQLSWSSTRSRYEDFKESYTAKYGKPADSFEFFIDPYEKGDGYELQAIKLEKGYYTTFWELSAGTIFVGISASNNSDGWVRLVYEDAAGVEIMNREKNQIIEDDI